ncbi:ABC transporter permease [Gemmatimonadota bacterium]
MTSLFEGVAIALSSVRANKARAALTILGVAIGVTVVMVIASVVRGINAGVTGIVEQLGPRTFFMYREFQAGIVVDDGSRHRRPPPLTAEEADWIARSPRIAFAVKTESAMRSVEFESHDLSSVPILGRGSKWLEAGGGDIYPGRTFTLVEEQTKDRVAVVNKKLADELFGTLDPLGKRIKIGGIPHEVIGVFNPPPSILGQLETPQAMIPHATYVKHLRTVRRSIDDFMVAPVDGVTVDEAIEDVIATMRIIRKLRPGEDNNFDVVTQDKILESFNQITGMFFVVMIGLSGIALMVGGIGVVAIMMISVTERTREIGVRKALGAKKREILWQFLVEAATLTLIGGVFGMILGGGITVLVRAFTPLPASVPFWSVVAALCAATLTGVGFGLYPAARAARLNPVDALRYE